MASAFEALIDTAIGNCMQAFGELVVYTEPGHLPQQLTGVFDEAYRPVLPLGDFGREIDAPAQVVSASPVLGVQVSQFRPGHLPVKEAFVFLPSRGLTFTIREVEADGHGWAKLMLNDA